MFLKFVNSLKFKDPKVRKCCDRWSKHTKQLLIDNKVGQRKQEIEMKYYLNG